MENRTKAFTLSEVLITLGIIGVVAAFTIPTLMNNSQKSEDFTKLQKAISVISDAASSIRNENGSDFSGLATDNSTFAGLFKPYLKTIKICQDGSDSENCYIKNTDKIYTLDGQSFGNTTPNHYFYNYPKMTTADGFVYWFEIASSDCFNSWYTRNSVGENCGAIYVDTNGTKSPNTFGKDIFTILVNKYNVTPWGNGKGGCSKTDTTNVWNGNQCSSLAILHGKIDYY